MRSQAKTQLTPMASDVYTQLHVFTKFSEHLLYALFTVQVLGIEKRTSQHLCPCGAYIPVGKTIMVFKYT